MIRIKIVGTNEHEVENIAKELINYSTTNDFPVVVGKSRKCVGGYVKQVVINNTNISNSIRDIS